ncbi:putative protein N(5)-glutamine methyltransferase [Agromyces soli]|uniref:peptide chain release factor N(5)-glutamine methyltransferase n=1 Tax=Agromyces soli TaxID=659012 RepID=A0ABY4AQ61_9MICO|nr:putative protein N(5)-glutamine methyltransferase [Agromyces soli]UOE24944.1 putative protein N(5)-glutamine methyltransferase [Agromyces soli]
MTSSPALPPPAALAARLRAAGCVYAEEEAALLLEATSTAASHSATAELERLVVRREAGEPLEQLLGWAEFDGLRLQLEPGVFVPRARTLLVAREAVRLARRSAAPATMLDLCCGVGAIGALLQRELPEVVLVAVDLDEAAVTAARRNLEPGGAVVRRGDLFDAVPVEFRGGFDVIAVNAPYVPTAEIAHMPPEAREHEHRLALDGGDDGLALHRRIAAEAGRWLRPGGTVVIECAERQSETSAALFAGAGFSSDVLADETIDATAVRARLS